MDKIALIQAILGMDCKTENKNKSHTFLQIGKVYAVRTVTMIYTGRLIDVNDQEFLFDEVAWIPDTERWMDFVTSGAHKEAEPYPNKVTIGRGGLLDATEIPSAIRKQK